MPIAIPVTIFAEGSKTKVWPPWNWHSRWGQVTYLEPCFPIQKSLCVGSGFNSQLHGALGPVLKGGGVRGALAEPRSPPRSSPSPQPLQGVCLFLFWGDILAYKYNCWIDGNSTYTGRASNLPKVFSNSAKTDITQVMGDSAFLLRSIKFHRSAPISPMVTREPKISNAHNLNLNCKIWEEESNGKTCMFSVLFKSRTKNARHLNWQTGKND